MQLVEIHNPMSAAKARRILKSHGVTFVKVNRGESCLRAGGVVLRVFLLYSGEAEHVRNLIAIGREYDAGTVEKHMFAEDSEAC